MKASLKFRDQQKPLFRAKVPVSLFGFPFQSGIAAGESKELSLSLATLFDSGPSLRVAYRPNDSSNPFSLELRSGIGAYGSPNSASMTMTAEFNPLQLGNPRFFIRFRPHLGDFSLKKTHSSDLTPKSDAARLDDGSVEFFESPPSPPGGGYTTIHRGKPPAGGATLVGTLVSDVEARATTALPVRGGAVVKCRWGVRLPAELRHAPTVDPMKSRAAGISIRHLPTLVMDKIAIEQPAAGGGSAERAADAAPSISITGSVDQVESYFSAKCRMASLQSENGLLRKAVEDLRSEISQTSGSPSRAGSPDSGRFEEGGKSEFASSASRVHRRKQSSVENKPFEFAPPAGKIVEADVS